MRLKRHIDHTCDQSVCPGYRRDIYLWWCAQYRINDRIQALGRYPVETTETLGVDPDWVEAMAFAWLAYQNELLRAGNRPSVTGAHRSVVLGIKTLTIQTAA